MANTKPLNFKWNIYHPDQREYRNQSLEIEPATSTYIQIDVPDEYIIPSDHTQIITLAGLKYVIDQFDAVFLSAKKEVAPDDDWEKDEPKEEKKSDNDDWESDADFDDNNKETDKVPWEDDGKDWQ